MREWYFSDSWSKNSEGAKLLLRGEESNEFFKLEKNSWVPVERSTLGPVEGALLWTVQKRARGYLFKGLLFFDSFLERFFEGLSPEWEAEIFYLSKEEGELFIERIERFGGKIRRQKISSKERAEDILYLDLLDLEEIRKGDQTKILAFRERTQLARQTVAELRKTSHLEGEHFLQKRLSLERQIDSQEKEGLIPPRHASRILLGELAYIWKRAGVSLQEKDGSLEIYFPEGTVILGEKPQFIAAKDHSRYSKKASGGEL